MSVKKYPKLDKCFLTKQKPDSNCPLKGDPVGLWYPKYKCHVCPKCEAMTGFYYENNSPDNDVLMTPEGNSVSDDCEFI